MRVTRKLQEPGQLPERGRGCPGGGEGDTALVLGGPSNVAEPRCTLQELEFISASREVRRAQVHHRCP